MPECPICGNSIRAASKTVSVFIGSSNGNSTKSRASETPSFIERRMGMYACDKCMTRFPIVLDRRHYVMVPIKQLRDMQNEIKRLGESGEKLSAKLDKANEEKKQSDATLKTKIDEADIRRLEDKIAYLQSHAEHLKRDKGELEEKIASLSPQAQVAD